MYEEYSQILCSTALSYDAQFKTGTGWVGQPAAAHHAMYTHLMTSNNDQTGDVDTLYNIDTGIDIIQANLTNQQPLSTWLLMPLVWDKISGNALTLWKTIFIANHASILAHFTPAWVERPPGRAKTPAIRSYLHEIVIEDEDPVPSINSAMDMSIEQETSSIPLLVSVNVTKQTPPAKQTWMKSHGSNLPPSDIHKVLSSSSSSGSSLANGEEIMVNGKWYHQVSMAIVYSVSA